MDDGLKNLLIVVISSASLVFSVLSLIYTRTSSKHEEFEKKIADLKEVTANDIHAIRLKQAEMITKKDIDGLYTKVNTIAESLATIKGSMDALIIPARQQMARQTKE